MGVDGKAGLAAVRRHRELFAAVEKGSDDLELAWGQAQCVTKLVPSMDAENAGPQAGTHDVANSGVHL